MKNHQKNGKTSKNPQNVFFSSSTTRSYTQLFFRSSSFSYLDVNDHQ